MSSWFADAGGGGGWFGRRLGISRDAATEAGYCERLDNADNACCKQVGLLGSRQWEFAGKVALRLMVCGGKTMSRANARALAVARAQSRRHVEPLPQPPLLATLTGLIPHKYQRLA